ncbi:MAG: ABC transporter permease [Planctomycetes bacterium]|nr:ABC transporter permease [Planctomycetota bacterium]
MRWLLQRLAWAAVSLLGISMATAALLALAPLDPAVARTADPGVFRSETARASAVRALRERAGWVDPATGARRPFLACYGRWLRSAVTLDLAPEGEAPAEFRRRLARALATSALIASLALGLALGFGAVVGVATGWLRPGSALDRAVSLPLLGLLGLPEFLLATLALLAIGWLGLRGVPVKGLRTPGTDGLPLLARLADLARHAALPALLLAVTPAILIARFLRESVARALDAEWVFTLRAFGTPARTVRQRVLAAAARPVWTQLGTILPALVTGAVVIEQVFSLPGFGRLAFQAALQRDVATIAATTHIGSAIVLLGLIASDALHRLGDPRVRFD